MCGLVSKISNSIWEVRWLSDKASQVQTYSTPIMSKVKTFFIEISPNLSKLIQDFINLFKANKTFLWWLLRMYIYVYIILYVVGFWLLTFAILNNNDYLDFLAKSFLLIFRWWSAPVGRIRSKINYILQIPVKILGLFARALFWIWSAIEYCVGKRGSAECMRKDEEEKKDEESKSTGEHCFENAAYKTALSVGSAFKYNSALKLAATSYNIGNTSEEDRPDKILKRAHEEINFTKKWSDIDDTHPCTDPFAAFGKFLGKK